LARNRLTVAIPASIIADTPHPREKTSKIGFVGRTAAIFRVNEIIVFADNPKTNQNLEIDFIATLLSYMETPQYLRKHLFGLRPELQFAGILPPLRTPHHPLKDRIRDLKLGEYREGVALSNVKDGILIDIGVEKPAFTPNTQIAIGKRITVKVTKIADQLETQIADRSKIVDYWGYNVSVERRSMGKLFEEGEFDLVVATSKFATRFQDVLGDLGPGWKKAENKLVLFGAPTRGLHEIAKDEGKNLNDIADFVLNTVPGQGTETVRTEEALLATLAVLNLQFDNSG
jgi:predicted SPOUT superfamily RNA methylase MTH1